MKVEALAIAAGAFGVSVWLTGLIRQLALRRGLLDVPNRRSSHSVPTPRGGGAAIVIAMAAALVALTLAGEITPQFLTALGGGGLIVALVGFLDDRKPLPARVRLVVHFLASLWALAWLGGLPPLQFGGHVVHFGPAGYVLGAVGIVWTLNLFNFMDGIDGIAASEAVFVAGAGVMLAVIGGVGAGLVAVSVAFGAACCGFLVWNWPPARIFMGDVGSGYLGFSIAVIAIAAARDNPIAPLGWLTLGGIFFVDATVTFARRLFRGEAVHVAHRSHAYQYLARRWGSHRRVTMTVVLINVFWLTPWACAAVRYPSFAPWIVAGALVPLGVAAIAAGAGRAEIAQP